MKRWFNSGRISISDRETAIHLTLGRGEVDIEERYSQFLMGDVDPPIRKEPRPEVELSF